LTDFRQTFVTGASWDTDDLITFLGQKVKVQGHTIAAEAHSTRRYRRVHLFLVNNYLTVNSLLFDHSVYLSYFIDCDMLLLVVVSCRCCHAGCLPSISLTTTLPFTTSSTHSWSLKWYVSDSLVTDDVFWMFVCQSQKSPKPCGYVLSK